MPKNGVTTAAGRQRKLEEIRATARLGHLPISQNMRPVDILMGQLKRAAGFCFWIESKLAEWDGDLLDLLSENVDDKGVVQSLPTNQRGGLLLWQAERKHLATVAK